MVFNPDRSRLLGAGAFGCVYYGKLHDKPVAAKLSNDISSLQSEAYLLELCDHMNVIKCHGLWFAQHMLYLVMELAEAGTLGSHLGGNFFSTRAKKQLIQQMCRGIGHVHAKNILHRDIHVQNLFLKDTRRPHLVIGDFGCATILMGNCGPLNDHYIVRDRFYTFKSDVYLMALVAVQIFWDSNNVYIFSSFSSIKQSLEQNTLWGTKWRRAILNSLHENPDVRPTVIEFREAFS